MKSHNMHKLIPLAFSVMLTLLLSACVTASGTQTAAEEPVAAAPEESVEPWDGDGMDIPLDGSSVEAFEKSLARVKVYASPAKFTQGRPEARKFVGWGFKKLSGFTSGVIAG